MLFLRESINIQKTLEDLIEENLAIKSQIRLEITFSKMTGEQIKTFICSTTKPLYHMSGFEEFLDESEKEIHQTVDQFTERGSGWVITKISKIFIKTGRFRPHKGGCFSHQLPAKIKNKKCLINIRTETDCFMYSVLAALSPDDKSQHYRTSYYDQFNTYDFGDVRGKVELSQINKFENKNEISINVYSYEYGDEECVIPLRMKKDKKKINM